MNMPTENVSLKSYFPRFHSVNAPRNSVSSLPRRHFVVD
jgi:hypothetical protein